MSGEAGRKTRVYIGTSTATTSVKDANAYITDIAVNDEAGEIDLTGLSDSNYTYDADLEKIEMTLTGNDFSSAAGTTSAYAQCGIYDLLGTAVTLQRYAEIAFGTGTASGVRKWSGQWMIMSYNVTAKVGDKRGFTSRLLPVGSITKGAYS